MALASALRASDGQDRAAPAAGDAATLANPEPDFFILGAKAYGRNGAFLLQAGYAQVEAALSALAARLLEASAR